MKTTACHPAPLLVLSLLLATLLAAPAGTAADYSSPYLFTTLAGTASVGSADGSATVARFDHPYGVCADAAGNVYVADAGNHTIRKIAANGSVTTLAGTAGSKPWNPLDGPMPNLDGTGPAARFLSLWGITVDPAGNVYVTDEETIRKITPAGVVTTFAGLAGSANWGTTDGTGSAARFNAPNDVAADSAGNVYVADTWNHAIRKITPAGVVTTFAGLPAGYPPTDGSIGSADGVGSAARFNFPQGVAVDAAGNVYVADTHNNTIRKISPAGSVTTLAGLAGQSGSADGVGSAARFNGPYDLAVDSTGNVYVADNWNRTIRKVTPAGAVTTLAGLAEMYGGADGTGSEARFGNPVSVTVDAAGTVFVADVWNNSIRSITPAGRVATYAGVSALQSLGNADGPGPVARFEAPHGAAVDGAGNVFVADTVNHTIRKISPAGAVTTVAGAAGASGAADGSGGSARLYYPKGVAADAAGNAYVADTWNHTVRKVTPAGVVSTLAGAPGSSGATDGSGSTARLAGPEGVAVDAAGNVYVADTGNHTIRKISAAGSVTTLAGAAGSRGSAGGTGDNARLNQPKGVAVDGAGNVYVADTGNFTIRKISPAGVVTTVAGAAGVSGSVDGPVDTARFAGPEGIAVDGAGNLFVTDNVNYTVRETTSAGFVVAGSGSYTIRKITPAGVVSTVAGQSRGSTDGLGSRALFDMPFGVAADAAGNVYVTCSSLDANTVRKGQPAGPPVITTQPQGLTVAAGGKVQLTVAAAGVPAPTYQWYFNGSAFSNATASTLSFDNARSTDAGDYSVVITNELGSVTSAKATVTVSAVTAPTPDTTGGGGGGGATGGATGGAFALALVLLTVLRTRGCFDRELRSSTAIL